MCVKRRDKLLINIMIMTDNYDNNSNNSNNFISCDEYSLLRESGRGGGDKKINGRKETEKKRERKIRGNARNAEGMMMGINDKERRKRERGRKKLRGRERA